MSSKQSYERLLQKNYPVDKNEYNRFDSLESNDDLELLYEVLQSVKDKNNNPAIITGNNIVANPNFDKMRDGNFQEYHYEPFTETLSRYSGRSRVMELYREGISKKIFTPQLHGREHINLANWLQALQEGRKDALDAFNENMFTVAKSERPNCRNEYLDSFGTFTTAALASLDKILKEGADLFEQVWGFRSVSVIAPCYTWHPDAEKYFFENGIRYMQGGRVQKIPKIHGQGILYKRHFTGQVNKMGQVYLVRNAFFEPSTNATLDWVNNCLDEIKNAFFWGKPAIISVHRLNFIGSIDPQNRAKNLRLFKQLLSSIVTQWPEAEFMSSDQLGDTITKKGFNQTQK